MNNSSTNLTVSQEKNSTITQLPLWFETAGSTVEWYKKQIQTMNEVFAEYEREQAQKNAQIVININWSLLTGLAIGFAIGLTIALLK
jgi:hypothetical protein